MILELEKLVGIAAARIAVAVHIAYILLLLLKLIAAVRIVVVVEARFPAVVDLTADSAQQLQLSEQSQ